MTGQIYLIGSLRNPVVPRLGARLRTYGFTIFDDWHGAGRRADDEWRSYEAIRGRSYKEALQGAAARNTFDFDRRHLEASDAAVMVMPAGKSCHLELGWMLGQGKRGYVLFDKEPKRYDVMYLFANDIFFDEDELVKELRRCMEKTEPVQTAPSPKTVSNFAVAGSPKLIC